MTITRRSLLAALPAAASLAALAACGSVPPTRYYTLARPAPAAAGAPPWPLLVLAPVRLPELLDRPQRVRRLSPTQVQIDDYALWAQPLREEIAAAVAADLTARWPTLVVDVRAAAPVANAPRLQLQVDQFETDGREAAVAMQWFVQGGGASPRQGQVRGQAALAGPGDDAAVAALGLALSRACADLAVALR